MDASTSTVGGKYRKISHIIRTVLPKNAFPRKGAYYTRVLNFTRDFMVSNENQT